MTHGSPNDATPTRIAGSSVPAATGNEIDAEIADHLATAAERLQAEGATPEQAQSQVKAKFGDTEPVRRSCYWIQQGDSLMFRGAVIALLSILCLGLTITAVASWRSQARMAEQMTDLTAQLKALAERPPTAIPAKADLPLELTGQVYVGDPSRPVANQEVRILNVKDGSVVRRVMSDSAGRYRSGPLNAGDYSIAGEIQKPRSGRAEYLQSPPAYVYPGTQLAPCNLDLAYRAGRLKLELSRPLPKLEVEDKYTIDSRLMIRVYSTEFAYSSPWTTQQKMPARWPAFLISIAPPTPPAGRPTTVSYFELLSNQDLTTDWDSTLFASDHGLLPAGTADVAAAVLLDVIPSGFRAQPIAELISNTTPLSNEGQQGRSKGGIKGIFNSALSIHWEKTMIDAANAEGEGPLSLTEGRELTFENDDFFWISKGLGRLWFAHLSKNEGSRRPFRIHAGWVPWRNPDSIPIKEGHVTRLLIDIPADLETRLRDFAMAATTPEEFSKRIPQYDPAKGGLPEEVARGENPFVGPVKLTVVSTEATADSSALPAGRN